MPKDTLRFSPFLGQIALKGLYYTLALCAPVLYAAFVLGRSPWPLLALLAGIVALGFVCAAVFAQNRTLPALILTALAAGAACLIVGFQTQTAQALFVLGLAYAGAALLSARTVLSPAERLIPNGVLGTGLLLYFVFYILAVLSEIPSALPMISVFCLAYTVLSLFLGNDMALRQEGGGQAGYMLHGNRLVLILVVCLLLVLVFVSAISDAVRTGITAVLTWLGALFAGGAEENAPPSTPSSQQLDLSAAIGEAAKPEWLRILQDVLFYALGILSVLAFAVLMAFVLFKTCRNGIEALRKWLDSFAIHNDGEEYTEHTEQLLSFENMGKQLRKDLAARLSKAFKRKPAWERLTPAQRVRRVYEKTLSTLLPYTPCAPCMTPEQLVDAAGKQECGFAELYNGVRYGEQTVTAAQAEKARTDMKGIT